MGRILIVIIILMIMFFVLFVYAMAKTAGQADEDMEKIFSSMHKKEEKTDFKN